MSGARESLVAYYRALRRYGLNDSHSGNGSVRDNGRIWITPTGAPAELLEPGRLVECALPDIVGRGASLDARLHLAVYGAREDAGAVLHAHSPHTLAMTLSGRAFRPVDHEARLYFPEIPVVVLQGDDYWERHKTEGPARVAGVLSEHRICVLAGHGVYARGGTLDEAYKWLCSLEHSARIAYLANRK